jgi:protein-S-isoprenylcysteine O-methyltransferase Ste14
MSLPSDASSSHRARGLDIAERLFLLALGIFAFWRLAPSVPGQPAVALILVSEGLAVVLVLLRKPAVRADFSAYTAAVAFLGTAAPLLVVSQKGASLIAPTLGGALMMAGLVLNISAKVALNRSFGVAAANRGVKRRGPYRFLRHPMYLGYATTQVAFLLLNPTIWNLAVYSLAWSVQIMRIQAEERVLLEDPTYRAYAGEVRYRLLPGVY